MNKTTTMLAIVAVFAAAALVAGALAAPVAYASGDTTIKQINKAKASASGIGTIAANIQQNCLFSC
jgi:hypothetical protein